MVGAKEEKAGQSCNSSIAARLKSLMSDKDITDEFFRLAKELRSGEIVMHPSYSLNDAVSAIELMDPKMDSGMEKPDPTLGLQNALNSGKLKQKLSVTELLSTVDCTFAALASWINDAQSLDQTVFTNIWLHDLNVINDPVHQALSKAAVFLIQLIRSTVNMAACYSEEDFASALTIELPLMITVDVLKQLQSAEEIVASRIKAKQNKNENTALLNRIRVYQQIIVAFDFLIPPTERSAPTDKKWQPRINSAKTALKLALAQLQNARDTVRLGRQPSNGNDGDYSWINCFQPKVNHHSLPPTFPREVRFMSRLNAYEYMITVFQSILNMIDEAPEANNIISLDTLLDYLERYSYAGIITRSLNQLILLPIDDCLLGIRPMVDLVTCSITEFAPSIQQDKLQQYIATISADLSTEYDEFLMDCVRGFLSVIQLFGHNRTRFHDKYLPDLIDVFMHLRSKALSLEANLRGVLVSTDIRQCFSTFSDFYANRFSILYLDMGFQLELFVDYELPYVFWCYSDVLYRRIADYCKSRSQMITYDMNFQRPNSNEYVREQARERHARGNLHRVLVYEDLSTAYFLLFSALVDDDKIRVPLHEENRFWHRMFPCTQMFSEEELSYDRYWNYFIYARESDDPPFKMNDWMVETRYKTAIDYFKRAESTMIRNHVLNESLTRAIKMAREYGSIFNLGHYIQLFVSNETRIE